MLVCSWIPLSLKLLLRKILFQSEFNFCVLCSSATGCVAFSFCNFLFCKEDKTSFFFNSKLINKVVNLYQKNTKKYPFCLLYFFSNYLILFNSLTDVIKIHFSLLISQNKKVSFFFFFFFFFLKVQINRYY